MSRIVTTIALSLGALFALDSIAADKKKADRFFEMRTYTTHPGKLADLIVVEGNPLENIRLSEQIRFTVLNGRIYEASTMNQVGHHPEERAKFYWEAHSEAPSTAP